MLITHRGIRYRKLISTEKENAIELGFDVAGGSPMAAGKKRPAPSSSGEAKSGKKAKTDAEDSKKDEDESDQGKEAKREAGCVENGDDD